MTMWLGNENSLEEDSELVGKCNTICNCEEEEDADKAIYSEVQENGEIVYFCGLGKNYCSMVKLYNLQAKRQE